MSSTLREGWQVFRTEGFLAAVRGALRVLGLNYQGYYYVLRRCLRCRLGRATPTEPFTVLWVDPDRITTAVDPVYYRWRFFGEARPGEWDQSTQPLDSMSKYRSVVEHFEEGTPWPETPVYKRALEHVQRGESYWNGCVTETDIQERTEHIEDLFERIQSDGYKTQSELHGRPLREIVLDRRFDRSKEEIAVAIGRDGELLFVDGNHRLAIAHVLGLDEIPVHVVTRHEQWEHRRRRVQAAGSQSEAETIGDLDHPDLQPARSD